MNKKTKLTLGGIGVSAVVAGVALTGGTSAYFYDLEQQTGNQVEACGFDLTYASSTTQTGNGLDPEVANGQHESQASVNASGAINIQNVEPGDVFQVQVTLDNTGDCSGDLWGDVDQHFDQENSLTEPEMDAGDNTQGVQTDPYNNSQRSGELGDYMQVQLVLDDGASESLLYNGSLHGLAQWFPQRIDPSFAGSESPKIFTATITAPESPNRAVENKIMTDSYSFELDFALAQEGYMPDSITDLSGGSVTP